MTGSERHYTGAAGKAYHAAKHLLPREAVLWVARLRASKIQPFVQPGNVVFEYGAGAGWNLVSLRCARRIAFDISDRVDHETADIEWIGSLDDIPVKQADCVICHHTLEHLIDPAEALHVMREILRPGGLLLLFVPFEKERRYRHFHPSEPNHHLFSWNVQTLSNLVTECGWEVQSAGIGEFGYDRFAAQLSVKLRLGELGFRTIRRIAHWFKPAQEVRVVAQRP